MAAVTPEVRAGLNGGTLETASLPEMLALDCRALLGVVLAKEPARLRKKLPFPELGVPWKMLKGRIVNRGQKTLLCFCQVPVGQMHQPQVAERKGLAFHVLELNILRQGLGQGFTGGGQFTQGIAGEANAQSDVGQELSLTQRLSPMPGLGKPFQSLGGVTGIGRQTGQQVIYSRQVLGVFQLLG